jgi:AcrR family transcriptional regulator
VAKVAKIKSKKRLTPKDREQEIIDEAVQFFAEVGFDGKTRELAKRIGITQPLLYRYFPTKDDLIERVYKEVYVNQMDPDWSLKLKDRSVPLEQRLIDYYISYAKVVHRYEWIRIYFFSGLKGNPLNRRYIRVVEEEILMPICEEIRVACDLPLLSKVPLAPIELERVWVMHGGLFYYAVRKNIYHSNVFDDFEAIVTSTVKIMLEGVKAFNIEELDLI